VRTPAIDALAADGVVFEAGVFARAPDAAGARVHPVGPAAVSRPGVRDNVGFTVKNGERLLPQMLRDRGFTTGGVVSAYVLRKETGISQGFDFSTARCRPARRTCRFGQVQRDGTESEAIAEHWLDTIGTSRAFLFLAPVRAPQALRAAGALRRVRALRRRDRLRR